MEMAAAEKSLLPVDDAQKIIAEYIKTLPAEEVKLTEALDRILADDIYADTDIPQADNSAMDGYAVKASDIAGVSPDNPATLEVIEDVRAGQLPRCAVGSMRAVRIMTGALIPDGADTVVMVEDTRRNGRDRVDIFRAVVRGKNIRRAGEDIRNRELVIRKGTRLKAAHMGILASIGKSIIPVTRRPKVAILATGDEVVDIDDPLEPGKLRNSNTYTLYNQIIQCGGIPKNLGIARDKPEELEEKVSEGLDCDLILTSGGISVGDYDLVKYILTKMGTDIKFWKVAIRPGKPLIFGLIRGIPVFGLPGNPVSSMISFEIFVCPAMVKMSGQACVGRNEIDAVLEEDIDKKKGLRYFLRAETRWADGVYLTHLVGPQGSGILKSMARANSLIIAPEEDEFIAKGTRVTVRFLD